MDMDARSMDNTSKLLLIMVFVGLLYISSSLIIAPFLSTTGGDLMLNFSEPSMKVTNMILILLSLGVGWLFSILLSERKGMRPAPETNPEKQFIPNLLTPDEQKIIKEVSSSGEITQDSLRFRLEWSKAKLSAVLTNLERMNIVQRERMGKTNNIFLSSAYKNVAGNGGIRQEGDGSERSGSQDSHTSGAYRLLAWMRRRKHQ